MDINWRRFTLLLLGLSLALFLTTSLVYSVNAHSNSNNNMLDHLYTPRAPNVYVISEAFESWTVNGPSGPPDGWTTISTKAEQESTYVHSGNYAVKLNESTAQSGKIVASKGFSPALQAGVYQYGCYIKNDDPVREAGLRISFYQDGEWNSFFQTFPGTGDWELVYLNIDLSSGGGITPVSYEILVYQEGNNDGIYFDDLYLDQVSVSEFPSFVPFILLYVGVIVISIWLLNKIRNTNRLSYH